MAVKLTKKAGTATVTKETKNAGETVLEESVSAMVEAPVEVSIDPLCEVGFEASYTHNLGNYQSCRVQVSLKIPCSHGEIDEVFDFSKKWVDEKLGAEVEGMTSGA